LKESQGGLGLLGKSVMCYLNYLMPKNVKKLCASHAYHKIDYFLTFTCNQKRHFGIQIINIGLIQVHGSNIIMDHEQQEIKEAVIQSAAGLLSWITLETVHLVHFIG
jgi:hypothetical protein